MPSVPLHQFFDLSLDLLCIAGTDGYFRRVNPAFTEVLGFTEEELLAQPFLAFVHPDDVDATLGAVGALSAGERVVDFKNRYRTRAGHYRWISWRSMATPDGSIYAVARDVTEQEELIAALDRRSRELEKSNQDLQALSYAMSHDLKAPLRAILGYCGLLVEHQQTMDPEAARLMARVIENAQRMGVLIDELLEFGQVNQQRVHSVEVDMEALARDCFQEAAAQHPGRTVELHLDRLPAGRGDPALLRRVWANLLQNAAKYTGGREEAHVTVRAYQEDGATWYEVADNGVGFDARHAERVWRLFDRLHSRSEFEGTGVGLALVARVVDRHGGRVRASSEPGQGARFAFCLGAAAEE